MGVLTELTPIDELDLDFYSSHVFTLKYKGQVKIFACAIIQSDSDEYEGGKFGLDTFLELKVFGNQY